MTDLESLKGSLLARVGATETYPFGPDPLVVKVAGKIFALLSFDRQPAELSLKCDPDYAQHLRSEYPAIRGGYHLDKRLWNTLVLDGSLDQPLIERLIDESYQLVVASLTRKARAALTETITQPIAAEGDQRGA